MKKEDIGGKKR